jgi:branched-chain amino acid aminotransferase
VHVNRSSSELASFDGQIGAAEETGIPVTDGGLLHADGAFEVIRIYGGRPLALGAHLERLTRSADGLLLDRDDGRERIAGEAEELLAARGGPAWDGILRVVLTRGGHRLLITEPLPRWGEQIRLGSVEYELTPLLVRVKSLSYGANMAAGRSARKRGFEDALLVKADGTVLEAPTCSFFYVLGDGVLRTPPLSENILDSITRDLLMRTVAVEERSVTLDEVCADATETFIASTTREVQSVAAIDERDFGAAGPLTRAAAAAFSDGVPSWLE